MLGEWCNPNCVWVGLAEVVSVFAFAVLFAHVGFRLIGRRTKE